MSGSTAVAAVMPAPGQPVETRELPLPELEPDSALLKVELSEICGTDVYLQQGRLEGVPYPLIPGHVSVGTLERIRGTLTDVNGRPFEEGDRVTFLDVHGTCHECWHCTVAKASTRCPHRKVYGITYGLDDGLTGGWCSHIYLKPGVRVIRMDGVDSRLYMTGGCSLPTALHAVERADVRIGDRVLVLGAGPVGLSAIVFSVLRGAQEVYCIGAPDHRLDTARRVGAKAALDFTTHDMPRRLAWLKEHTAGHGPDVVIECTGAPAAVVEAMRYVRDAGTVLIVGQYTDHGEIAFNPHVDLNKKHVDVRGCWGSDYSHFHRGVEMMRNPMAARLWESVPLESFSLSEVNEALAAVQSGRVVKALVTPAT